VAAPAGLAGAIGLETLRELVGGSLAAVITEVEALGGTVTSVSGRGLQAMFGAPQAHEDDPERAVLAAFRALTAAATAEAAAEGGTALRIGVESGPAVVGPIGGGAKVEYGALGDVVSVAAALQSAARPGAVLVGPATRAVTGHLFTWGAGEEVSLGGTARPLVASYLEAPRARVGNRRPRGVGGRAALIGRDAEMQILETALRQAVEGRGSVVVLTGDAGLGKTRLVQECRKRFIAWVGAGSGRLPLWLEGRGASYASATPYGLYRQLVASWVGVAPDEPAARLQLALERALTNLMGNANLLPPLARMMGIAYPAATARMSPEDLQRMTFGGDPVRGRGPDRPGPRGPALGRPDLAAPDPRPRVAAGEPAPAGARHQPAEVRPGGDRDPGRRPVGSSDRAQAAARCRRADAGGVAHRPGPRRRRRCRGRQPRGPRGRARELRRQPFVPRGAADVVA
jgi:class 3 adenylate cyclase